MMYTNKKGIKKIYIIDFVNIYLLINYTTGLMLIDRMHLGFMKSIGRYFSYIMFFGAFIYIMRRVLGKQKGIVFINKYILIFGITVLCTSLMNGLKIVSIRESLILIGTSLYAIYLVNFYNHNKLINLIFISQLLIAMFTFVFTIIYPETGKMIYEGKLVWRGAFIHKNLLAANMAFGILVSITCYKKKSKSLKKSLVIINIILSGTILIMSGSMTSLVIVISAFLIYKIYSIFKIKVNPVYLMMSVHLIVYYIISNQEKYNEIFTKIFNRDLTFTGRLPVWEAVLELIKENAFWGYGYNSIWLENSEIAQYIRRKVLFDVTGSHHGILEWILNIGVVGTLILILILIITGHRVIKLLNYNKLVFKFSIQYIVYILIFYLTERSIEPLNYQILMIFITIALTNKTFYKVRNNTFYKERNRNNGLWDSNNNCSYI